VDLAQLTRIAITGKTASPPVFQVAVLLGKAETITRLKAAALAAVERAKPPVGPAKPPVGAGR